MPRHPEFAIRRPPERFGALQAIGPVQSITRNGKTRRYVLCLCDCGNTSLMRTSALLAGRARSCGCRQFEGIKEYAASIKGRGVYQSREYKSWEAMIRRCHSENGKQAEYGKRGIIVCERWRRSFKAFLADMGPRPPGHSIERVDVNGNYEPGNCIWADRYTQSLNKRTTRWVEYHGKRVKLAQLCRELGVPLKLVSSRLFIGWSLSKALTEPNMRTQ